MVVEEESLMKRESKTDIGENQMMSIYISHD
jgi:hypothetical protein